MSDAPAPGGNESRQALAAGVLCYLIWGWVPLYFQLLGRLGADAWEIVGHRTAWAVPSALILVLLARQWRQLLRVLRTPRTVAWLTLSALLIAANWLTYIGAVNTGQLLEGSLGYYINPLFNMAAGAIVFRERISRIGFVAIGLAAIGVVIQGVALGHMPWIALILGISFGAYGVVRKRVDADAQTGLAVECILLAIPGVAFAIWLEASGGGHFLQSPSHALFLILSGPVTVLPLALFSWAARRMPLSVMGFLQFLGPTIGFGIGIAQGESFTPMRALSFAFIWAGAAVFVYGAWRASRTLPAPQTV